MASEPAHCIAQGAVIGGPNMCSVLGEHADEYSVRLNGNGA
jgi:hypothetical protein